MLLRQPADFWQPRLELGLNQRITETTFLYSPDSIHKLNAVPAREGDLPLNSSKPLLKLAFNSKQNRTLANLLQRKADIFNSVERRFTIDYVFNPSRFFDLFKKR